ncbi:MAG: T9SS type A sorting domain-containing protein [Saprospiraceae bacterium]|nr:T9SS type A sorting domain-containing protein [Saprospiraceae bacterium]
MNTPKHLHSIILLFVLIFSINIGNTQVAVCKTSVTVSTNPWSCSYTLLPSDINNGSSDYDMLSIDKTELTVLGPHLVTLTATKNSGQTSSCTCNVTLADKAAPIAVGEISLTVGFNEQNSFTLLPSMLDDGSYDHCSAVTFSVSPSVIDCNSPNPLPAILTVTDAAGNSNQVITMINIVQNKNRVKQIVCKSAITFGVPPVGIFEITADSLLEGGPYACPSFYDVVLKHNNVTLPKPLVGPADIGKTFEYTVTDPETQSRCFGTITIIGLDCTGAFTVCDTESRCTPDGDCNAGHTLLDDIEWPCDITVENAPSYLLTNPTPQIIADFLNVPLSDFKPIIFGGVTKIDKCLQLGESITTEIQGNIIKYNHAYINFADTVNRVYTYQQTITLNSTNNVVCEVCDTLPWNAPFGDCTSGHTSDDAVEWPADISVDFLEVSPYDLSLNQTIHPNDVSPILNTLCDNTWLKSYSDFITEIGPSLYLVERNWSILNTVSSQIYAYIQNITINAATTNSRNVCFTTLHDAPITNVNITPNVTSGEQGCSTMNDDGSIDKIKPYRNDTDFQSGLDVEDIIMLKEYIFGVTTLNEMQKSAADLNADKNINNNDAIILNSLLTNQTSGSPFYSSPWKFIKANDFYFKNTLTDVSDISSPFERYHFKGMKIGDLNDSYNRNENILKITTLKLDDQILNQGEMYAIKTNNVGDLRLKGFQLAIEKNGAFDIVQVLSPFFTVTVVDKGDHYLIVSLADDQYIRSNGYAIENQASMLKIIIKANQNVVLHDVFKLYENGNKIVSGHNRELTTIKLDYNGSIPTSALDFDEPSIAIFPNPTTGLISLESSKVAVKLVQIIALDGKTLYSTSDLSSPAIDISHLSNGFYTMNIILSNGKNIAKKLVKI